MTTKLENGESQFCAGCNEAAKTIEKQAAALKLARDALLKLCGGYPLAYSKTIGFREANEALAAIDEALKGEPPCQGN